MSTGISIFVSYDKSLEELMDLVEPLAQAKFKYFHDKYDVFFEARTCDSIIYIGQHSYENDRDLNFEDFRFEIGLRPIRDKAFFDHEHNTWANAKKLFAELTPRLRVNAMLVGNLQHKLDVYNPALTLGTKEFAAD